MARSDAGDRRALARIKFSPGTAAIDAAKARTKATPLAGPAAPTAPASRAPLSRTAYVPVRSGAFGEYLDMLALTRTREAAENLINERQRIHAAALRKGAIDAYLRVAFVEIRELEEGE